ncbi:hypothetical protein DACRYDRAFT_20968 [Dacryopinax primogenitus]|uniref:Clathrin light chain n=1 Tax=Dacryopinax primogenitus (strain DJM 731) TaxID=1858805 RepID=M5GFU3_DACPD|nr:uncharacterized protein DACRYDRAFT_20968 [Dacryopinax primogenitus]EJU04438.1 hypothetical protein DACRYDRAFT_20968 [Dacryopinax primogenitus]
MDIDQELDRANSAFTDITDDFDPTQLTGTISSITGDDEVEKFDNQFPELDDAPSFQPMAPAQPTLRPSFLGGAPVAAPSAPAMSLSPAPGMFSQEKDEEEPEVIKENEAQYLDGLNASLSEGTMWSSLIELENSQSKTLARAGAGTTDLSRYKEVLLRLRREGDRVLVLLATRR